MKREHIIRATLESLAYQVSDVLDIMMEDVSGGEDELSMIKVDGGASKNNFLLKFTSDILRREIIRPMNVESTALGCAYMAALACGFWNQDEIAALNPPERTFEPDMPETVRYRLIKGWKDAVKMAVNSNVVLKR